MAQILFFAGDSTNINNLNGSGLGLFGSSFGNSVSVGAYQQTTYITNAAGTDSGPLADNIKWTHAASGLLNAESDDRLLQDMPNVNATLNMRFTHSVAVKTQNAQVNIYDRVTTTDNASGVTTQLAELIHPNESPGAGGSGDTAWLVCSGTRDAGNAPVKNLTASPGSSGLSINGPDTTSKEHDFYLALSASPDSIGSKSQYGLYFQLEYL